MCLAVSASLLEAPLLQLGKALAIQGSFDTACHFLESRIAETPMLVRRIHSPEKSRKVILKSFKLY